MRGSTTAITDIDGNVTDRYTYGVYGDILSHTGTGTTPFLYNGRDGVMTDANGLYYLRARYYSPELMRFVNADTVKGNIKDSRTLNNYAYANGDPVSLVDPFGTSAEPRLDIGHAPVTQGYIGMLPNDWISLDLSEYSLMHYSVQYDMLKRGYATCLEFPIQGSSKKGNTGFADAVNFLSASVWEVKPITQYGWKTGRDQLDRYIDGLNNWGEYGTGFTRGFVLFGAFNVTLPGGLTFGVTYECDRTYPGMVYYTPSATLNEQEAAEPSFSYAFADNRRTSIYKQATAVADWNAAGKAVGIVIFVGALAYAVLTGDTSAAQKTWDYVFQT